MNKTDASPDKGRMPDELFEEYWAARAKHVPESQREVAEHAFYSGWTLYAVEMQKMMKEPCPPHRWDRSGERCVKCGDKDWMT